jgi:hypothetical protein
MGGDPGSISHSLNKYRTAIGTGMGVRASEQLVASSCEQDDPSFNIAAPPEAIACRRVFDSFGPYAN